MIVPRQPKREIVLIGKLEFTFSDPKETDSDRTMAWVEIGDVAKVVVEDNPNAATDKAIEVIRELSGENGRLFFRQVKDTLAKWEVGV